jgi:hypothetical protein
MYCRPHVAWRHIVKMGRFSLPRNGTDQTVTKDPLRGPGQAGAWRRRSPPRKALSPGVRHHPRGMVRLTYVVGGMRIPYRLDAVDPETS